MNHVTEALHDLAAQLEAEGNPAGERLIAVLNRQEALERFAIACRDLGHFLEALSKPAYPWRDAKEFHAWWKHGCEVANGWMRGCESEAA